MRTSFRSITTTAALAAVVAIGAVGCGSSKSAKSADTSPTTAGAAVTTLAPSSGSTTTTGTKADAVVIKNFSYNPAAITVKEGAKVTWTNDDGFAHTVTDRSGPVPFNSGHIGSKKSFSVTFAKPGTYQYFCGIHNYMTGTVTVTP